MRSLSHGTVYNAIGSVAMLGSGFLATVIAARLLGPEAFGVLAYATMIVGLSLAILDLGLPGAMTRFLPELDANGGAKTQSVAAAVFLPFAGLSCVAAVALFLLLPRLGLDAGRRDVLVSGLVAGSILVQSLAAFHYGILKGRQQFARFAALATAAGTIQVLLAWLGARHFGIVGALAAPMLAFAVPAVAALGSLRFTRPRGQVALLKRLLSYSAQTWLIYVFTTFTWSRMEIYFLRHAWGDQPAGLFAAGLNLANLTLQVPVFLTGALLPYLVTLGTHSPQLIAPAFKTAACYFSLIVIPASFGAAAIAPALLQLLYGEGFRDAAAATSLLILGNATMSVFAIVQIFAFATGRTWPLLAWTACTAALTVVSGLTLISAYGTFGAAVGRTGLQATTMIVMLALIRAWGWPFPYVAVAKIVAAAAIMAVAADLITRRFDGAGGIILAVVTGIAVFATLCAAMQVVNLKEILARRHVGLVEAAQPPTSA